MLGLLQKITKKPSINIAEPAQLYPEFTFFGSHSYLSHYKYVYTCMLRMSKGNLYLYTSIIDTETNRSYCTRGNWGERWPSANRVRSSQGLKTKTVGFSTSWVRGPVVRMTEVPFGAGMKSLMLLFNLCHPFWSTRPCYIATTGVQLRKITKLSLPILVFLLSPFCVTIDTQGIFGVIFKEMCDITVSYFEHYVLIMTMFQTQNVFTLHKNSTDYRKCYTRKWN